jgi:hypothetical protein
LESIKLVLKKENLMEWETTIWTIEEGEFVYDLKLIYFNFRDNSIKKTMKSFLHEVAHATDKDYLKKRFINIHDEGFQKIYNNLLKKYKIL